MDDRGLSPHDMQRTSTMHDRNSDAITPHKESPVAGQ